MINFSSPAILIRRFDYGESDQIITLLTLNKGKFSVIAKHSKKSVKRFLGVLELFHVLQIECKLSNKKRLPVLEEAVLKHPFSDIRKSIKKSAYACYWAQLIYEWLEQGDKQDQIYYLFLNVLQMLDQDHQTPDTLSVLFQIKLMTTSGYSPNFYNCNKCHVELENIKQTNFLFSIKNGGFLCEKCQTQNNNNLFLSKGTIKQLQWIQKEDLKKAARIKFSSLSLKQGLKLSELFVSYHIGKDLTSLNYLRKIRKTVQ